MDYIRASEALQRFVGTIDQYASLQEILYLSDGRELERVQELDDEVRLQVPLVTAIVASLLPRVASDVDEEEETGDHHWKRARRTAMHALGVISTRAEAEAILGPKGPQLAARDLHVTVWSAAAHLWDDGHHPQAVQTAAQAVEGHMQGKLAVTWSGEHLGQAFSVGPGRPRLRFPGLEHGSNTWKSAHEGAAFLVRGAMLGVRNLVSHPGMPRPSPEEALEQLAILSHVCRLVDRATVEVEPKV